MSFWDDLKDLFKTDDQKDEEQKRRLAELKAGESELEKKLADLDAEYQRTKSNRITILTSCFQKNPATKRLNIRQERMKILPMLRARKLATKRQRTKTQLKATMFHPSPHLKRANSKRTNH